MTSTTAETRTDEVIFVEVTPAAARWMNEITVWEDYPAAPELDPDRQHEQRDLLAVEGLQAMIDLDSAAGTAQLIVEFDECEYGLGAKRAINTLAERTAKSLRAMKRNLAEATS